MDSTAVTPAIPVALMGPDEYKAMQKRETEDFKKRAKVGDLFCYSYGYEQTNIRFYRIKSRTKATAVLEEIGKTVADDCKDGMGATVTPNQDEVVGPGFVKRFGPGKFKMPHGSMLPTREDAKHYETYYA